MLLAKFFVSLNSNNELGYITIKMKTVTGAVLAFFVFFNYTTCIAKQIPPKSVSSTMLKCIMIFFLISVHLAFFF